jgi:Asp-tRNA(Asn)/Glu-tRNA(Gln) amidotransferase A subunit family amidase
LIDCHQIIYDYEIYRCLKDERQVHWDQLSDSMKSALERAKMRSLEQYEEAKGLLESARAWFETFFHDYDAIITPSAPGEAVLLNKGTGDPICSTIWTLCGLPCISLPLLSGDANLPIGVQLITAENQDDRLFRTSRWLLNQLRSATES